MTTNTSSSSSSHKTTIGLFDAAFKKKEEAARLWKEKNDLRFTDSLPSSPTPPTRPTTTENTAEIKGNDDKMSQMKHVTPNKEEEVKDLTVLERITVSAATSSSSPNTTKTLPLPTSKTTIEPDITATNEVPSSEEKEEEKKERDQITRNTSNSSLSPYSLAQSLDNLTVVEKAVVTSFIIALLYLHLSFHSLQEVLSYDYLALLSLTSQRLASLLPLLLPDLSLLEQRCEEVVSRLSYLDVIVIPVLLTQLIALFDWSPERTDATLFSCTRLIAEQVVSWRSSFSSFLRETWTHLTLLYTHFQQKTPRVFRIVLALSLASFLIRYVLLQAIGVLTWFFCKIVFPWRYYGLAILAVVGAVYLTHLYLARQQNRKEVIARLSQLVKELLEKKEEQQAAVDYLYYEIQDQIIKQDLATPSSAPRKWWQMLSFLENERCKGDVTGGFDLGGHSLPSLWNEVQKEVGKDKRVRTFLMFVDGAQRKCWKMLTATNPPLSQPSSSQQ